MDTFIIEGGKPLSGEVTVGGAKNAALKLLVAACLTQEIVTLHNVPSIADVRTMISILRDIGVDVQEHGRSVTIHAHRIDKIEIPLEMAIKARTSIMFLAPLLLRNKRAIIPNPGGCRLGARPVDRTVAGLEVLGANISYNADDGYFHAETSGLHAGTYTFPKSTHIGTETMIIAAACAQGTTILKNAACEPEIDDLIGLINAMGGSVRRTQEREITIDGVQILHGAEWTIQPDRNEIVTFAITALATRGEILVRDAHRVPLESFHQVLSNTGAGIHIEEQGIRYRYEKPLIACDVTTAIHPGFMTDWQAPWAVLMTQAIGEAVIHETVFENRFGYIKDLKKMGAKTRLFNPVVSDPEAVYSFNPEDDHPLYYHAVSITGPTQLHNAVVQMEDIRAGAAVVIAALAAKGRSTIFGIEKLDRGYEMFDKRLHDLGATIERRKE
jgi:UDP-N-acetylglucosamine 1-carboxyvinyltransferase